MRVMHLRNCSRSECRPLVPSGLSGALLWTENVRYALACRCLNYWNAQKWISFHLSFTFETERQAKAYRTCTVPEERAR